MKKIKYGFFLIVGAVLLWTSIELAINLADGEMDLWIYDEPVQKVPKDISFGAPIKK